MRKKVLSILLILMLALSLVAVPVSANEFETLSADKTAQWTAQERFENYDLRIHGWSAWETAAYMGFTLPANFNPNDYESVALQLTTVSVGRSGTAYLYAASYGAFNNGAQYQGSAEVPSYTTAQLMSFANPSSAGEFTLDITDYIKGLPAGTENVAFRVDVKSQNTNNNWIIGSCTNSGAAPALIMEASWANAEPVTYSVSANGSAAVTSTEIAIAFDKPVTGLTTGDITLNPASAATVTGLTASEDNKTWTLAVEDVIAGNVAISLQNSAKYMFSYEGEGNTATLFVEPAKSVKYVISANGDETASTTELTISFDIPVTGLSIGAIAFDPSNAAMKTRLTASDDNMTWTLALSRVVAGDVTVSIADNRDFDFSFDGEGNKTTFYKLPTDPDDPSLAARQEVDFDGGWKFNKGDATGAQQPDYNDASWDNVALPHSTEYVMYDSIEAYLGIAWYRKTFTLPEELEDKQIFINFGAAMQLATVYVNGTEIGVHQGGFMGFTYDITDQLLPGVDNVIAVKLDTRANNNWLPGNANIDFRYHGGLYRSVKLIVNNKVHLTDPLLKPASPTEQVIRPASGGVFIHSDTATNYANASDNRGITNIQGSSSTGFTGDVAFWIGADVKNDSAAAVSVTVKNEMFDPSGAPVWSQTTDPVTIAPAANLGDSTQITDTGSITGASLWHPSFPNLYTLVTSVFADGELVDELETRTGFKSIVFTNAVGSATSGTKGRVVINGENWKGLGTNTHQEIGMVGFAVPEAVARNEARMLKDAGYDIIRLSHYPYQRAFLEACDEYGIMVQQPITGWQNGGASNTGRQQGAYREAQDMMRRDRNSPSVVIWELAVNEGGTNTNIAPTITANAKLEIPTRNMYTQGGTTQQYYDIMAVHSTNNGQGAFKNNAPNIYNEFGDWDGGGYASTTRHLRWRSTEAPVRQSVANYQTALDRSQGSTLNFGYYWVWQDYTGFGEGNPDTISGSNVAGRPTPCGIVDMFRVPKYAYYYAQSQRDPNWTFNGPDGVRQGHMIYIANRWFDESTQGTASTDVPVYTNAATVKLFGSTDGGQTWTEIGANKTAPDAYKIREVANGADGYAPNPSWPWKSTDSKPWTFGGISHTYTALKAEAYNTLGQKVAEDIVKDPRTLTPSKVDITWWADWNSDGSASVSREEPMIANGGDKRLLYIDVEDAEGNLITNSGTVSTSLTFGTPTERPNPVTVTVTEGDAWILGGETANEIGAKSATITPRGGQVAVWVVAGTTADDVITVTATSAGLESDSVQIATVAPKGFQGGGTIEPPDPPSDPCIAYNKPSTASSGTASRVNDGDDETVWTAATGDAGEYWQVNLLGKYDISDIQMIWAAESAYKYWVQYSTDGNTWLPLTDKTENTAAESETVIEYSGQLKSAQYIRVLFTGASATPFAVKEIHINGEASSEAAEKNFADAKPSWSNDLADGSEASWGNDGVPTSFATMKDNNAGNTWWVDMQGFFDVDNIDITWFETASHKYKLETSADGVTWQTVLYKNRNTDVPVESSRDSFSPALKGVRFLRITSAADTIPMSFTHVSVFGTESTDLALAKPVSSDSAVTAAANQPLYAVDNDDATAWVPDGPGKYLQVDIGARQNIYGINLVWPNDSDRDYAILASIDGSTWYKYFDGSTTEAADVHSIYIPNAQYLRVLDKKGEGLASFEVFGSAPAEAKTIFPEANLLANPNFEDNAAADISSWYKLAVTDASAVQSTTSGSTARPEYNISHGTIGDRYAYMYAAMPYSASLYQPVTGLPNGIYELRGWVKRGHPEAGTEQAELYAYVENYGGETIVNNLLETVPRTNAIYTEVTGNTTAGRYPYTEIVIGNIHVTNGQLTVGFFANAPANNGANSSYAFIDDFSLRQISQDPAYPPDGETFNGYVNIGIAGGNVSAEFNLATSDVSKTPLAIIAAYRENGTLADQKMEPLNFNGKSVLSYSLELDGYNPNYTYVAYLWDSVTYVPIMEKTVMSVKSVEEINVFPLSTDGYTLPDEVTVRYNNSPNGIGTLPVTWDGAPAVFSEIGEYVIMGTVEGTDIPATANVTVKGANLLSNPTLDTWDSTTGASPTGWVRSSTTGSRFSRDVGAKNQHTPGGGAHYSASYYLGGTAAGANVHLYQTLNLEPGKYVLSCYTQGLILPGSTGGVTLYHSTGTTAPTGQSSPITSYNGVGDWQNPTYTFTVTSAGNISVGVVCNLNNGTWLQVDDFELSKIG